MTLAHLDLLGNFGFFCGRVVREVCLKQVLRDSDPTKLQNQVSPI